MKQAYVNGEPIPREAVQFELDRLVKFYPFGEINAAFADTKAGKAVKAVLKMA